MLVDYVKLQPARLNEIQVAVNGYACAVDAYYKKLHIINFADLSKQVISFDSASPNSLKSLIISTDGTQAYLLDSFANKVIFIDAEGGFSIERMKQLAGDELQKILKNILLLKPTNFDEQNRILEKLPRLINQKIGLVIVDTLTVFYRLELAKSTDIKEINTKLISQISYLNEIARKKRVPILITNQVYSDFHKKDDVRMVGGDILRYSSKCLIKLEKNKKRKATLITHRSIPEGKEIEFSIINNGIIA